MNNLSKAVEVIDRTGKVIAIKNITVPLETSRLNDVVKNVVDSSVEKYLKTQIVPVLPETTYELISKAKINLPKLPYQNNFSLVLNVFRDRIKTLINDNTISALKLLTDKLKNIYVQNQDVFDQFLFFRIANEIGFPIYIEANSELQRELIHCYRENGNQCDKEKMRRIVFEYYNDVYVDKIFLQIIDAGIFCPDRNELLFEAVYDYQIGSYGGAGAILATQFGGIIEDAYALENTLCEFTSNEKQEIMDCFGMNKKGVNGDKAKAFLIMSRQQGVFGWYQISKYFQEHLYSSKEDDMQEHPKRHKVCHGIQLRYNTKEMNLKLIMCLQILAELAWRVQHKQENISQVAIER